MIVVRLADPFIVKPYSLLLLELLLEPTFLSRLEMHWTSSKSPVLATLDPAHSAGVVRTLN